MLTHRRVAVTASLTLALVGGVGLPVLANHDVTGLTGGTGTYTDASGTVYAKAGQTINVRVSGTANTTCVTLAGSGVDGSLTDTVHAWRFSFDAVSGNGTKNVNATVYRANTSGTPIVPCHTVTSTPTLTYIADNRVPIDIAFVSGPVAGQTYASNNVPPQPTCTATDPGALPSGIASCVVTGYGTTVGTHTMTATATDRVGNSAQAQLTYYVIQPLQFSASAGAPVDGGSYRVGTLPTTITCTATYAAGGGVPCFVSGYQTGLGTHTVTFTATDAAGTVTRTRTYTVLDNIVITPTADAPADGGYYRLGTMPAAISCTAVYESGGAVPGGCDISGYETGLGTHTVTFSATDAAGTVTRQHTYTVLDTIAITPSSNMPQDGATYFALGMPYEVSCTATYTSGGEVPCTVSGYRRITGTHTVTMVATDLAGSVMRSHTYNVSLLPVLPPRSSPGSGGEGFTPSPDVTEAAAPPASTPPASTPPVVTTPPVLSPPPSTPAAPEVTLPPSPPVVSLSISGPARSLPGGTVQVSGRTTPGAPVQVWFKASDVDVFELRRRLVADEAGAWSTSYVATADQRYFAVVGDVRSRVLLTALTPVLDGADTAPRGSVVTLRGAVQRGGVADVYFRRAGSTRFVHSRVLPADPTTGRFSTTYVADATYEYFVVTGPDRRRSAPQTTRVLG